MMMPHLEIELDMRPGTIVPEMRAIYQRYDPHKPLGGAWSTLQINEADDPDRDDFVPAICRAITILNDGRKEDIHIRFDYTLIGLAEAVARHYGLNESAKVEINDCGSPFFVFGGWAFAYGAEHIYLYHEV